MPAQTIQPQACAPTATPRSPPLAHLTFACPGLCAAACSAAPKGKVSPLPWLCCRQCTGEESYQYTLSELDGYEEGVYTSTAFDCYKLCESMPECEAWSFWVSPEQSEHHSPLLACLPACRLPAALPLNLGGRLPPGRPSIVHCQHLRCLHASTCPCVLVCLPAGLATRCS